MRNRLIISEKISSLSANLNQEYDETLSQFMEWVSLTYKDFALYCGWCTILLILGLAVSLIIMISTSFQIWFPVPICLLLQRVLALYMDSKLVEYIDVYIKTYK